MASLEHRRTQEQDCCHARQGWSVHMRLRLSARILSTAHAPVLSASCFVHDRSMSRRQRPGDVPRKDVGQLAQTVEFTPPHRLPIIRIAAEAQRASPRKEVQTTLRRADVTLGEFRHLPNETLVVNEACHTSGGEVRSERPKCTTDSRSSAATAVSPLSAPTSPRYRVETSPWQLVTTPVPSLTRPGAASPASRS